MERTVVDFVIDSSLESFAWLRKRLSRMSVQQVDFFFSCVYSLIITSEIRFSPDKAFQANRIEKTFRLSFSERKNPSWKSCDEWNFNRLIDHIAFLLSKDKRSFVQIWKEIEESKGIVSLGTEENALMYYSAIKNSSVWLQSFRKALWQKKSQSL